MLKRSYELVSKKNLGIHFALLVLLPLILVLIALWGFNQQFSTYTQDKPANVYLQLNEDNKTPLPLAKQEILNEARNTLNNLIINNADSKKVIEEVENNNYTNINKDVFNKFYWYDGLTDTNKEQLLSTAVQSSIVVKNANLLSNAQASNIIIDSKNNTAYIPVLQGYKGDSYLSIQMIYQDNTWKFNPVSLSENIQLFIILQQNNNTNTTE